MGGHSKTGAGASDFYFLSFETCLERARNRLSGTAMAHRHWMRWVYAVTILLLESRVINFVVQVYMVVLAILLGYGTAESDQNFLAFSIIVLIPVALGRSLGVVVLLGKLLNVHDVWRLDDSDQRITLFKIAKGVGQDLSDKTRGKKLGSKLSIIEDQLMVRGIKFRDSSLFPADLHAILAENADTLNPMQGVAAADPIPDPVSAVTNGMQSRQAVQGGTVASPNVLSPSAAQHQRRTSTHGYPANQNGPRLSPGSASDHQSTM